MFLAFCICIYYLYYNYLLVYMESFFSEKLETANYSLTLLLIQQLQINQSHFFKLQDCYQIFQDLGLSLEVKREIPKKTDVL